MEADCRAAKLGTELRRDRFATRRHTRRRRLCRLGGAQSSCQHPPFDRVDLEVPLPTPKAVPNPPEPALVPLPVPRGLVALFGKKRHAKAVEKAQAAHELAVAAWREELARITTVNASAIEKHAEAEAQRIGDLKRERVRYDAECSKRETDSEKHNEGVDALIVNLGYGTVEAVQDYVSIVLSNSVYPDCLPIDHDFDFDPAAAELRLRVLVPSPCSLPDTRLHKYVKSSDEISKTALSQKAQEIDTLAQSSKWRFARCTRYSKPTGAASSRLSPLRSEHRRLIPRPGAMVFSCLSQPALSAKRF